MVAIEEIFSYQFSFADIEADKYIEYRRSHADPRIHAMDRLTDDVVDELVKLCLPFSHKKNGLAVQAGRPYMRLEMMVRLHLLQISLNYSDLQMEVYLTSNVAARLFCRVPSGRTTVSDTSLLRFRGVSGKLFKSTLNNRLHRNLACVIDKSSRGAKLERAFEELPQDCCVWGGYSRGSPTRLPFPFCDVVCQT